MHDVFQVSKFLFPGFGAAGGGGGGVRGNRMRGGRLCCVMKAVQVLGYGSCRWRCHGNADGKGELALGFNTGLECLVSVKRLLEAVGPELVGEQGLLVGVWGSCSLLT